MIQVNIHASKIIEIDPCGENGPLVIQADLSGFIDSSALEVDDITRLKCEWQLHVKMDKTLTIKAHTIQLDDRYVLLHFEKKHMNRYNLIYSTKYH